MTTPATARLKSLAPLYHRNFRLQFAAQTASVAGSMLSPVALALAILQTTKSPQALGIVLTAYTVPMVIFVLIGGVWADRLPRQQVMVAANLVRAVTACAIGTMFLTGHAPVWALAALQLIAGIAAAFYQPAETGMTASTTPATHLQEANALLSLSRSTAGVLGPVLASVLVISSSAGWALIIDGITFVVGAWFLSRIKLASTPPPPAQNGFVRELSAGFGEVRSRPWIWSSIVAFAFTNLGIAALFVAGPAILLERDNGEVSWGAVVTALSIGQLAGNVMALRLRPARMLLAARIFELAQLPVLLALALTASLPWLVVGAFICGIGLTYPDSLWYTALQQQLPANAISRVSSFDVLGSLALRPVGFSLAAVVSTGIGLTQTIVAAAVLLVASRVFSLSFADVRHLRRIQEPRAETRQEEEISAASR